MIKTYIEECIKKIETERDQRTAGVKATLMREKITPYNADIDSARAKALSELDNEMNAKIVAVRQEYEEKKKEMIELGENKKRANQEVVFTSGLAPYTINYDKAIAKLSAQLKDIQE